MNVAESSLLHDFLAESPELVDTFIHNLVKLEASNSAEQAQEICICSRRAMHVIYGAANFLSLKHIADLARAIDRAMNHLSQQHIQITAHVTNTLRQAAHALKRQLNQTHATSCSHQAPAELFDDLCAITQSPHRFTLRLADENPPERFTGG